MNIRGLCDNLIMRKLNLSVMKGSEYVICFEKPLNFDVCSVYAAGSGNSFRDFCDCDSVYRIAAVTSGSGKLVAQNSSTDIKENDIFILFPHEMA